LDKYHREKLVNNTKISKRLQADHGIAIRCVLAVFCDYPYPIGSQFLNKCIYCEAAMQGDWSNGQFCNNEGYCKEIGPMGSSAIMKVIDLSEAEQMILEQMDKDTAKRSGVGTIQSKVAYHQGIHLPWYVHKLFVS
jgi:hypothetical protein